MNKRSTIYLGIILIMFIIALVGFNKLQFKYQEVIKAKSLDTADTTTKIQIDAISQGTRLMGQPIEITDIKTYQALNFNPAYEPAELSYNLSKAGFVNILITNRDDTTRIYRKLVDWQWRHQGLNSEVWDGKNDSGIIINPKLCRILVEAREAQDTTKKPLQD
jgi:hypothetical protein